MQIFVTTITGETITVEVEPTGSLADVKRQVQAKEGVPAAQQRFVFAGRHLDDAGNSHCTLADHGVLALSTLHLALRLRGGKKNEEPVATTTVVLSRLQDASAQLGAVVAVDAGTNNGGSIFQQGDTFGSWDARVSRNSSDTLQNVSASTANTATPTASFQGGLTVTGDMSAGANMRVSSDISVTSPVRLGSVQNVGNVTFSNTLVGQSFAPALSSVICVIDASVTNNDSTLTMPNPANVATQNERHGHTKVVVIVSTNAAGFGMNIECPDSTGYWNNGGGNTISITPLPGQVIVLQLCLINNQVSYVDDENATHLRWMVLSVTPGITIAYS